MLKVYRSLYGLLDRRERWLALLVFLLMLVTAMSEVAGVASIMPFIALLSNPSVVQSNRYLAAAYSLAGAPPMDTFLFLAGVAVFLFLVMGTLAKAVSVWAQLRFSYTRNYAWASQLVRGYLRQPYDWYLNRHSADLGSSILSEVSQVIYEALMPALEFVAHVLVAVLLVALLVAVDPKLAAVVAVVLVGAYALVFLLARGRMERLGNEWREANRRRFKIVQEALGGIKEAKLGGLEPAIEARFAKVSLVLAKNQIGARLLAQLPTLAMQLVVFGGMLLVLLFLLRSYGGLQQALPVVALYAFAGYRLMPALQSAYQSLTKIKVAGPLVQGLCEEIAELRLRAESLDSRSSSGPPLGLQKELEFREVSYSYPKAEHPALVGLNMRIAARNTVGIVGPTGSGKTTAIDVMLALLEPATGSVLVDGTELTPENRRRWQRSLGYVPQQIFLADLSVAANIAFGLPEDKIDMAAVERAAKIANLHDFVTQELPQGYLTLVGERGVRLSGGQRQRIGIARALYRDPDVLILDEATSALDNVTERAVMDAVRNLARQKTIVMIAHRLSTVRHCDRIFMLENGRVEVSGTYDELLQTSPSFRALAQAAT